MAADDGGRYGWLSRLKEFIAPSEDEMLATNPTLQSPAICLASKYETFEKGHCQRSPSTAATDVTTFDIAVVGHTYFVLGETIFEYLLGEQSAPPKRDTFVHSDDIGPIHSAKESAGPTSEEGAAEPVQSSILLLCSSPVAVVVDHLYPSPKVYKAPKDATPPDRGGARLDFKSEDIENTNDARGDHGCGPSGAQATAGKAIIKILSEGDEERYIISNPLCDHLLVFLCVKALPYFAHAPCPTPPARTVTQSSSQQSA
jgi:hypothetical protein